ncbi:MAG: triose-phosphate isomerase [Chitinophagaceae bacterium]|nr:MAG: triose-phosphate isomerase [Chitinophagaceae bacterium]
MRKQIAAANWKMNLTFQQGEKLLDDILEANVKLASHQQAIFAVPFPYLLMTRSEVDNAPNYYVSAQNCSNKKSGAYTGEVSAEMLKSIGIKYCIVGHSERREYFGETNTQLAEKVNILLKHDITPIFCCGEPLNIREANGQDKHVETQIQESLFHLSADDLVRVVIAYEPIWAIGTGKTASTGQAQEMHASIRSVLGKRYGNEIASQVSILYGGSVKANNAAEIFAAPDVDGGLVGGASLVAKDFIQIIQSLKS